VEDRPTQDLELVDSVLRGDEAAFGVLVGRYQRLVGSVAWRYGVPADEVEDVVSEVFLKVFRNLHRYRPDHPLSTWLYRVAVHHVIDRSRRSSRRPETTAIAPGLPDGAPGPHAEADAAERACLVRRALASLAPRYREALFLVYVEGCSVEETAGILELPQGTVKTRLMRGRAALRRVLDARWPGRFGEP